MVTIRQETRATSRHAKRCSTGLSGGAFTKPSERLREGRLPADGLSLRRDRGRPRRRHRAAVARQGRPGRPALLLGPLAVRPRLPQPRHRRGAGATCAARGAPRAAIAPCCWSATRRIYGRFGFSAEKTGGALAARAATSRIACSRSSSRPAHSTARAASSRATGRRLPVAAALLARPRRIRARPRCRARREPAPLPGVTDMNAINRMTESHVLHARFDGPIVMIGFGSIGRGTLPLLERHVGFDRSKFVVIDPDDTDRRAARRAQAPVRSSSRSPRRITARCSPRC